MIIDYDQIAKLVESNYEVRVRKETVNSSKTRISSIGSAFVPEISLYAQGEDSQLKNITELPTAGVYANLNLFNGFRDVEKNKIDNLSYEKNKLEYMKAYKEDVFKAKKYYL